MEDAFEFFSGLHSRTPPHGDRFRMDGATVDRWAKGWHVHVPPAEVALPCRPSGQPPYLRTQATSATDAAVRAVLADPTHPQHASVVSLSSRPHLTSLLNDAQLAFRLHVQRNAFFIDLSSGEWYPPSAAGSLASARAAKHAHWLSPQDDENLLDSIADWLVRQPPGGATAGAEAQSLAALLPHTTADWVAIRSACAAHSFSLAFLRRRMWLLCQQANEFDAADAAMSAAKAEQQQPHVCTNPALERLAAKVRAITLQLSQRMVAHTQPPHSSTDPTALAATQS